MSAPKKRKLSASESETLDFFTWRAYKARAAAVEAQAEADRADALLGDWRVMKGLPRREESE